MGLAGEQRQIELLGPQCLAADIGKWPVLYPVSAGLDGDDLDAARFPAVGQLKCVSDQARLDEGKRRAAAADDEALKKDLTAVIALQGLPCGQVVSVTTQAENDYAVTCKDENKYRVYVNAAGRVVVEKRK